MDNNWANDKYEYDRDDEYDEYLNLLKIVLLWLRFMFFAANVVRLIMV